MRSMRSGGEELQAGEVRSGREEMPLPVIHRVIYIVHPDVKPGLDPLGYIDAPKQRCRLRTK